MIRIFCGLDEREAEGFAVFTRSLLRYSSAPVSLTPLSGEQHGASNAFSYERFRVMELCGWSGMGIWLDGSDMMLRADIHTLAALYDPSKAVQVVKHDYRTRHPRKYIGTAMEAPNSDYQRKNWSSVMLINCGHIKHFINRDMIRNAVHDGDGTYLHRLGWLTDDDIGVLPLEWNHLVLEYPYSPSAKLAHFTLGIPGFAHYKDCDYADEWHGGAALRKAA